MPSLTTQAPCLLCGLALSKPPSLPPSAFCCSGCHAVYQVLVAKGGLQNYQDTPIFQQALRSGLISNPTLLSELRAKIPPLPEEEWQKLYLEVEDMWCLSCSEVIRLTLLQEKGIRNCIVDYTTDLASIEFAPRHLAKEDIYALIRALGYKPAPLQGEEAKRVPLSLWLRFIVAVFCAGNLMMFAYPIYLDYFAMDTEGYSALFAWLSLAAAVPIVTYCAWPIFRRFWTGLKVGLLGMEALVALGITTAFGLSLYTLLTGGSQVYFDSMSMIVVFVLLGKIIETKAKFSVRSTLLRLTRALPRRGRKVLSDVKAEFTPIKEIHINDHVMALMGEKIVLDGIVIQGEGACDESLMTGEAIPLPKKVGDTIIAGSVLTSGNITYAVTQVDKSSTLQKIIEMIEHTLGHKPAHHHPVDAIVKWFVPLVVVVASLAGVFCWLIGATAEASLLRTISILLISCPCAIGIAVPLAESLLMSRLASLGAIIRNRGVLQHLGKETCLICDKTGTLTEGKFVVLDGMQLLSLSEKQALLGLSRHSTHPIATAVALALFEEKVIPITYDKIEEIPGKGIRGWAEGDFYLFGSEAFLHENGVAHIPDALSSSDKLIRSTVYFAASRTFPLILGDRLRNGAQGLKGEFPDIETILLSGDSRSSVEAVAGACNFDSYHFRFTPLQKQEFIQSKRAQGHLVCMVGDGINDAPALTSAHIGISTASASDISIQVSDILLTTDRLQTISEIHHLGKRGRAIISQNLFWAFFYNILGLCLAVAGYLSPFFAALAMTLSSLVVTFNALRLKK